MWENSEVPDASSGIDDQNDEAAKRGDMLEAARDSDIDDIAETYISTDDVKIASLLFDFFVEAMCKNPMVEIIRQARDGSPFFSDAIHNAAQSMAEHAWEERYGDPKIGDTPATHPIPDFLRRK